jgi:NDP-sugar pyrophosphorylase family protein
LGDDDVAGALFAEGLRFAVLAIGGSAMRHRLFKDLQRIRYGLPPIVHATAVISASVRIGDGTVVMPNAVINTDAVIGQAAMINTGVIIDHDCWVGDSAHLAPVAFWRATSASERACCSALEASFGMNATSALTLSLERAP